MPCRKGRKFLGTSYNGCEQTIKKQFIAVGYPLGMLLVLGMFPVAEMVGQVAGVMGLFGMLIFIVANILWAKPVSGPLTKLVIWLIISAAIFCFMFFSVLAVLPFVGIGLVLSTWIENWPFFLFGLSLVLIVVVLFGLVIKLIAGLAKSVLRRRLTAVSQG